MDPDAPIERNAHLALREDWLAARKTCITGTDVAKILGLSRFGGPIDVYLDKIGEAPAFEPTEEMRRGLEMEPVILGIYDREVSPLVLERPFTLRRFDAEPLLGATLDARRSHDTDAGPGSVNDGRPVDAKNVRFSTAEWGEPDTDQMPLYYATQLAVQMLVTGADRADLAAYFSGNEFRVYTLHRDDAMLQSIVDQALKFWRTYVVPRVPPPADGSSSFAEYLKRTFAKHTDEVLRATPEQHEWAVHLKAAEEAYDIADAEKERLKNLIKQAIGITNAKAIEGPKGEWKAAWGLTKDSTGTDWEAVAKAIALLYAGQTGEPATHVVADLVKQNQVVTKKGSRRFTFTFN